MNLQLVSLRGLLRTMVALGTLCTALAYGQTETTLYAFTNGPNDHANPYTLIADGHGNFYGTTVEPGGTVFEFSPVTGGGWNLTTIYDFPSATGPYNPAGIVMDAAGNIYGVSAAGGGSGKKGVVFELSPNGQGGWVGNNIHEFQGPDGAAPFGVPILDSAGNLYGTASSGGKCAAESTGCGVAFELSPQANGQWKETILHSFGASSKDGQFPFGGLTFDGKGNLYGTTFAGGLTGCSTETCGTVFELTPAEGGKWTEKLLHLFHSFDGSFPTDTPTLDSAGNLYGTAEGGGPYLMGVVFELTPSTSGEWPIQLAYYFDNFATGSGPVASVTLDAAGNLYVPTVYGGRQGAPCVIGGQAEGCGTVWEFSPSSSGAWIPNLLYVFTGYGDDGRVLDDQSLVLDSAGNLFGATEYGGDKGGFGTIFEITP